MFTCTQNYRSDLVCPRSRSSRALEILCFILSPVMPSVTSKWKLQMPCLKWNSYTRTSGCQVLSKRTLTRSYVYRQREKLAQGFLFLAPGDRGKSVENMLIPGWQYPCPVIGLVLLNHGAHGQRTACISWHKCWQYLMKIDLEFLSLLLQYLWIVFSSASVFFFFLCKKRNGSLLQVYKWGTWGDGHGDS